MNGYLLIINETELNDVAPFDWANEVVIEWALQRSNLGSVDVVDSSSGLVVYSF